MERPAPGVLGYPAWGAPPMQNREQEALETKEGLPSPRDPAASGGDGGEQPDLQDPGRSWTRMRGAPGWVARVAGRGRAPPQGEAAGGSCPLALVLAAAGGECACLDAMLTARMERRGWIYLPNGPPVSTSHLRFLLDLAQPLLSLWVMARTRQSSAGSATA